MLQILRYSFVFFLLFQLSAEQFIFGPDLSGYSQEYLKRFLHERYFVVREYIDKNSESIALLEEKILDEKENKKLYILPDSKIATTILFLYYSSSTSIKNIVTVCPINLTQLLSSHDLQPVNSNMTIPGRFAKEIFLLTVRNPSETGRPQDWMLYSIIMLEDRFFLLQMSLTEKLLEKIQLWYQSKSLHPVSFIKTGFSKKAILHQEYTMNRDDTAF